MLAIIQWKENSEFIWKNSCGGITWSPAWQLTPAVNYQVKPGVMIIGLWSYSNLWLWGFVCWLSLWWASLVSAAVHQKWTRWLGRKNGGETSWRYQDRFRYFLKGSIPIKGKWYLASYNEIFIHVRRATGAKLFDQKRAYAALGATVNKKTRVEVSYLQQTLSRFNGRAFEYNHTFQLALFSTR